MSSLQYRVEANVAGKEKVESIIAWDQQSNHLKDQQRNSSNPSSLCDVISNYSGDMHMYIEKLPTVEPSTSKEPRAGLKPRDPRRELYEVTFKQRRQSVHEKVNIERDIAHRRYNTQVIKCQGNLYQTLPAQTAATSEFTSINTCKRDAGFDMNDIMLAATDQMSSLRYREIEEELSSDVNVCKKQKAEYKIHSDQQYLKDKKQDPRNTSSSSVTTEVPLSYDAISNYSKDMHMSIEKSPVATTNTLKEPRRTSLKPRDPRRELYDATFDQRRWDLHEKVNIEREIACGKYNTPVVQYERNVCQTLPAQVAATSDNTCKKDAGSDTNDIVLHAKDQVRYNPTQNKWKDVQDLIKGYDDLQKVEFLKERTRRIEETDKMFAAKKLSLVLDLDRVLLHSATILDIHSITNYDMLMREKRRDSKKEQKQLFDLPDIAMWVKLRPGIQTFLEKTSKLYELHLYTMRNQKFANNVKKILDQSGAFFAGRIICREDNSVNMDTYSDEVQKIKNLDEVKGLESAVVIMDVCENAWPHNKLNLIIVERYTFFPSKERQYGHKTQPLLKRDCDERVEDGTLTSLLEVLERIHHSFFAQLPFKNVDVRHVLVAEKQKILASCRLVFSGLFHQSESNPQNHRLWQLAEQFGAVCTIQLDKEVTHVVAINGRTNKVKWALSEGKHVVNRGWIEASAFLYRRANEQKYPLKKC